MKLASLKGKRPRMQKERITGGFQGFIRETNPPRKRKLTGTSLSNRERKKAPIKRGKEFRRREHKEKKKLERPGTQKDNTRQNHDIVSKKDVGHPGKVDLKERACGKKSARKKENVECSSEAKIYEKTGSRKGSALSKKRASENDQKKDCSGKRNFLGGTVIGELSPQGRAARSKEAEKKD